MTQFFRIIRDQSESMRHLIGDLLDVARIETGTLPVSPEPVEVTVLVDEARSRFQGGGGRANLVIDLPPRLPRVMADRRRVVQVLNNLLSNAARHSHDLSPILVAAVRDGVHVALSVADHGVGVPAEHLPHLFRKFSQLDGEERGRELGGSGLGLAICKGIVEAHGGRIRAESDGLGLGSRFTFTLPAVDEPARRAPRRPRQRREPPPVRILCVDDDPQTLRYVRDALTRAGYAPTVTGDPEAVPHLMAEAPPRLVLLDLVLPGADGIELMGQIREIADVPVIFLSVYGQDEVIARAFDQGAADYVVKPFSPTELAARIRAALRQRAPPELAEPSQPYVRGDLTVDYALRRVTLAGNPVALTAIEYRMLVELSAHAGRPLTHQHLLQRVWGPDKGPDSAPVRNIVRRLRRKPGRRPGPPQLHLRRAHRRLPHGGGRDAGAGSGTGTVMAAVPRPAAGTWWLPKVGPEGYGFRASWRWAPGERSWSGSWERPAGPVANSRRLQRTAIHTEPEDIANQITETRSRRRERVLRAGFSCWPTGRVGSLDNSGSAVAGIAPHHYVALRCWSCPRRRRPHGRGSPGSVLSVLWFAQPPVVVFEFSHARLSAVGAGAFVLGAGALVLIGEDGLARGGVVPEQLSVHPAEVEVQDRAVALQAAVGELRDGDGFVAAVRQPVAGQAGAVVLTRLVEAPVFRDAEGGVGDALVHGIAASGGAGGDLEDEVRWFALLGDDVAVARQVAGGIGVEGDQQVGVGHSAHALELCRRDRRDVEVRADDGGIGVGQVQDQVVGAAGEGQVAGGGHLLILAFGRLG